MSNRVGMGRNRKETTKAAEDEEIKMKKYKKRKMNKEGETSSKTIGDEEVDVEKTIDIGVSSKAIRDEDFAAEIQKNIDAGVSEHIECEDDGPKVKKKYAPRNVIFQTRCSPSGLISLISRFSVVQKNDIKSIGFGGLLEMRDLDRIPWQDLEYFVQNFNGISRVLSFQGNKKLVITANDVCDVLKIPRNEGHPIMRNDSSEVFKTFLSEFKTRLGIGEKASLCSIRALLEGMVDGGADFKRLFVLYALFSFLIPSGNMFLDLSLLSSLVDVEAISSLDWSSFVLDRLCTAVQSFQKNINQKNINACVLVLPIVYFHRFRWQGRTLPSTLPLIKHWTRKLIKDRVVEELKSGAFGDGEWVEGVYPITGRFPNIVAVEACEKIHIQPPFPVSKVQNEETKCETRCAAHRRSVIYHLLPTENDDDEISKIAKNPQHKALLLMKRDLNIFSRVHLENWSKIMSTIEEDEDKCPPLSPDTIYFQNTKLHESIDELVERYNKEKKDGKTKVGCSRGKKDDFYDFESPTFHLLTPQSQEELEACNTINKVVADVNLATGDGRLLGTPPSKKPCKESNTEKDFQTFFNVANDDVLMDSTEESWPVPEDFTFRCGFLNANKDLLSGMSRKEKDIVDFCFVGSISNVGNVFEHKGDIFVTFEAIRTLNDKMILCTIIDAWALLMNKSEKVLKTFKNLSFSTQHSLYVQGVANGKDQGTTVRECWRHWLTKCNMDVSDLLTVDRIFVPIWYENHYFALVVNFVDKKVHYLNNLLKDINEKAVYYKLATVVYDQMRIFLEEVGHCKAEEFKSYQIELAAFEWNRKQQNIDCAIFIMHQMENFIGVAYESSDLYELSGRKKLRAQYCARIVLSPLNGLTSKVKNDALEFIKNSKKYKQLKR